MNLSRKAIIDTSVLLSLYYLGLLEFLNLFYYEVRVPREVEREFLDKKNDEIERSKRYNFLENFYTTHQSWFTRCNEYDDAIIQLYLTEKNIDKGEAEIFAQSQSLSNVHELLLDENTARQLAVRDNIKHHGVLYILANLELGFNIGEYRNHIEKLKKINIGRFSEKIINIVYETELKLRFGK